MNKVLFFLVYTSALFAFEEAPWFSPDLLPLIHIGAEGHVHPSVNVKGNSQKANGYALSFTQGLSLAAFSMADLQLETKETRTTHNGWGFEGVHLFARYSLLNDLIGDPVSLMIGASYQFAVSHYLHDIDTFHHGTHAGALHLSIGKERSFGPTWRFHTWALIETGLGNQGSPWIRSKIAYDWNGCDRYEVGAFTEFLMGLGEHRLHLDQSFPGYSSIRHRSLDVGIRGKYLLPCMGWVEAKIGYRIWAYNFPSQDIAGELKWVVPFSL